MGIARGTNIVRDNLIFGYDTGHGVSNNTTATRFYPGEPTTNLQSSVQHADGQLYAVQSVAVSYVGEEDGYSKYSLNGSWTAGTYPYSMRVNSTSFTGGVKYSAQCKVKTNVPHKFHYFASNGFSYVNQPMDHSGTNSSTLLDEGCYLLKREGFAYTSTTSQPGYLWTRGNSETFNSSTDFVYIKDFMIEQKDHCTPWTATSRSNTQGLIDLKRTRDISLANMSFDSTGQPEFDGTDDYTPTTITRGDLGDTLTIIAYYKYTGNSSRTYTPIIGGFESGTGTEFFIGKNSGNTNIGVQDGNYSGSFVTGSNAWDGNYHQIVYTYYGGTGKIYLDGVLKSTGSFTKCNSAEIIHIGREAESSGYWFLGDIPRVSIYNKVLTAAEVTQDFNTYKNRFNI